MLGGVDVYVDVGSNINVTCLVTHSPEPPAHIFWHHNEKAGDDFQTNNSFFFSIFKWVIDIPRTIFVNSSEP